FAQLTLHNIRVNGRRTSVRLEPVMWDALKDVAQRKDMTINELASEIEGSFIGLNLTSAIRSYLIQFYIDFANRRAARGSQQRTEAATDDRRTLPGYTETRR